MLDAGGSRFFSVFSVSKQALEPLLLRALLILGNPFSFYRGLPGFLVVAVESVFHSFSSAKKTGSLVLPRKLPEGASFFRLLPF